MMRYALIDDATLESAKRMEGIIPGNNTLEVAGDILALENLIQAILFCDEILYLDPRRKRKDKQAKAFDSFRRISLSDDTYTQLLNTANKMTDHYLPCIEGGVFTDDCFSAFFKELDMEIRFVWEKTGNAFSLTPRIIRRKKYINGVLYRKLLSMILNELTDKSFLTCVDPRPPLLYDTEGQIINNCYTVKDGNGIDFPTRLSEQAEALFRALNYMAFRSNLHLVTARELGADLILSPMRNLFQWGCYNHFCLGIQGAIPSLSGMISAHSHQKWGQESMAGNGGAPAVIVHGIPKFVFWITEHRNCDLGFIKAAYELREEKEFVAIRRFLNELDEKAPAKENGDMPAALVNLHGQFDRIYKKYRVDANKGTGSAVFSLTHSALAQAKLPGMENFTFCLDSNCPGADLIDPSRKHFSLIYRSVRDDMLGLDETPEYFDPVTSRIKYKIDAVLQNIKVEMNGFHSDSRRAEIPM